MVHAQRPGTRPVVLYCCLLTMCTAAGPRTRPATSPDDPPPGLAAARDAVKALIASGVRGDHGLIDRIPHAESHPNLDPIRRWVPANGGGESVRDVKHGPLIDLPWGVCTYRPAGDGKTSKLYLHVFDWHKSGNVVAYGLKSEVKRAYLLSDPKRKDLKVTRVGRWPVIAGPREAPDPVCSVVALEVEGEVKNAPLAIDPTADGPVVLHARDAIVYGRTLRYEPEPHKDTIGYWSDRLEWVEWQFKIAAPGTYAVEILQGCGKGSGGSEVSFFVDEQALPVVVRDTGHFQNFVARDIGRFKFKEPGVYKLRVMPQTKPGAAVMDLRQVTLKPVPAKEDQG